MTRQTRTFIVLAVAVVAATVASYGLYAAVKNIPERQVEVAATHAVVANTNLPMGTRLTKDMVKLVPWPSKSPLEHGFSDVSAVVDRGLTDSLVANEPILESKLAPLAAGAGLPPSIPPGMRAISVKVNEVVGVAGFVVPGTRVDVVAVARQKDQNVSRIVVSNAQVLTAGTRYDQEEAVKKDAKPIPSTVVTLVVTPEDAQRIALAQSEGQNKLQLALRNPMDVDTTQPKAITIAALLGATDVFSAPAPAPAVPKVAPKKVAVVEPPPPPPPAPKPYEVEAIRAAKRTIEVVR